MFLRRWQLFSFLCLLVGCGFKPIQDSVENTLYAGELVLNIHSSDLALNNRVQREFKLIAKPLLKKAYRIDVQLNPQAAPGSKSRWHSAIGADLMIMDKSNHVIAHKQIETTQSFDHDDYLLAEEGADDILAKNLAMKIVNIINRLP